MKVQSQPNRMFESGVRGLVYQMGSCLILKLLHMQRISESNFKAGNRGMGYALEGIYNLPIYPHFRGSAKALVSADTCNAGFPESIILL